MRVSPAAIIFSNRTATLSRFVFPEQPEIADFFQTVNDWFDIFNSQIAKDRDVEIRSAFGMAATKQDLKLNEMEYLIASCRSRLWSQKLKKMVPRKSLLPCQFGILVSVKSLRGLSEDLKAQFGVTYIKTRNINQDALESHFSEIRALGRTNENPTASEFRNRLKLLLLGAKVRPAISANVIVNPTELNYMSCKLLEKAVKEDIIPAQEDDVALPDDDEENFRNLELESLELPSLLSSHNNIIPRLMVHLG